MDNPIDFLLGMIDKLRENEVENLGEKVLDGHQVIGFRGNTTNNSQRREIVDIWIDSETNYPVQIETSCKDTGVKTTWNNFVWNPGLADSLFDLTPPEGYEVVDETQ